MGNKEGHAYNVLGCLLSDTVSHPQLTVFLGTEEEKLNSNSVSNQ